MLSVTLPAHGKRRSVRGARAASVVGGQLVDERSVHCAHVAPNRRLAQTRRLRGKVTLAGRRRAKIAARHEDHRTDDKNHQRPLQRYVLMYVRVHLVKCAPAIFGETCATTNIELKCAPGFEIRANLLAPARCAEILNLAALARRVINFKIFGAARCASARL